MTTTNYQKAINFLYLETNYMHLMVVHTKRRPYCATKATWKKSANRPRVFVVTLWSPKRRPDILHGRPITAMVAMVVAKL